MPRQGAGVVVFNADRTQVLLQLREDVRAWGLPAGGFEPNEVPEQAAIREAREETGYDIEIVRRVGEYWRQRTQTMSSPALVLLGGFLLARRMRRGRLRRFVLDALRWVGIAIGLQH